jgi:transcriptional regulator with XRE-family HTH domain
LRLPRLKEVRELHGWSQKNLAEAAGVSRDSISNYETGHREAYPATARKLADALGVEIADLLQEPARPKEVAPSSPDEWAREIGARLHGMSDEDWDAYIRRLESVNEIEQVFRELFGEGVMLHTAHAADKWQRPEQKERRIELFRSLRELRAHRLADLAGIAAEKKDEALLRQVMEALLEEAHS